MSKAVMAMIPTTEPVIPSKKEAMVSFLQIRSNSEWPMIVNMKQGRNIPRVIRAQPPNA